MAQASGDSQGVVRLDARGMPVGTALRDGLEITPREARAALADGSLVLVDCRTAAEWDFVHIPGSVHVPLDEIERRHEEIEAEPGQRVAVICHHGVRSLKATLALRELGHQGTLSVAGGIDLWAIAADPGVLRYERSGGVCSPLARS